MIGLNLTESIQDLFITYLISIYLQLSQKKGNKLKNKEEAD